MAIKLHPVDSAQVCARNPEAVLEMVATCLPDTQIGEFSYDDDGRLWNRCWIPSEGIDVYSVWRSWDKEWEEVQGEEFEV